MATEKANHSLISVFTTTFLWFERFGFICLLVSPPQYLSNFYFLVKYSLAPFACSIYTCLSLIKIVEQFEQGIHRKNVTSPACKEILFWMERVALLVYYLSESRAPLGIIVLSNLAYECLFTNLMIKVKQKLKRETLSSSSSSSSSLRSEEINKKQGNSNVLNTSGYCGVQGNLKRRFVNSETYLRKRRAGTRGVVKLTIPSNEDKAAANQNSLKKALFEELQQKISQSTESNITVVDNACCSNVIMDVEMVDADETGHQIGNGNDQDQELKIEKNELEGNPENAKYKVTEDLLGLKAKYEDLKKEKDLCEQQLKKAKKKYQELKKIENEWKEKLKRSKEDHERDGEKWEEKKNKLNSKFCAAMASWQLYKELWDTHEEDCRKWEEERKELAAKVYAATASSQLYRGLLHNLEC